MIAAVVPGAGRSERFGGPKLVADVGGRPLVDRTLACLLDAGVDQVVLVVAPGSPVLALDARVAASLGDPRVRIAINPAPDRGMFSSIQAGVGLLSGPATAAGASPGLELLLVLPGDMPFVRAETVRAVIAAARAHGGLVSPRHGGTRGHPLAVPGALLPLIAAADPAGPLKAALAAYLPERLELDVADPGVVRDVDRPGDVGSGLGSHLGSVRMTDLYDRFVIRTDPRLRSKT
ncbi:MAG: nucleotidyltransferase family protein [Vicinamibacterales bacterium]